ncbi:gliding motility protein GldM [Mucilaginibacter sp. PPCGB 2223]|uniref:type IX secretion system motor protein PorM/GldM n=1 Tax=Mucilaginibacter sp. PPCGB 2223 TaxID=1886027 RepID=UPI0008270EAA|nr:gliding motility protein GldM [Mucilaginibacter sp. PPCGB 2223]OCX51021.1 gliding motility protein GldM [Mucilaginibacter sp. PPCGB 2223]
MAGGKQTPRARMINILYLVLLGLIALEAPANLLDAFKKIGDSLTNSKTNVQNGIDANYTAFEKKVKEEPERAKPILDKAKKATAIADELNNYIEGLKKTLIERTGGMSKDGDYEGRENVDEGNRLMIEGQKAKELKAKINETKEKLKAILDPQDQASISFALEAEDSKTGEKKTWEQNYFGDGVPMGAEMTTLIKIQSDVKNDEAQVQKKILSKMEQAVVTLDQFAAVAVAPSSYIIQGQQYKADIFLTAYDSKSNPDIEIDGSKIQASGGKGTYTVTANSEGIKHYKGTISVRGTDGKIKTYALPEQTYQVAKPSAVVSPDKMNVLYIGVANPLSVSAPGIPVDKIHISMSSGSYTGSNGHYEARVTTPGETKVTISAEIAPGKTQVLSSSTFRVKRIPDPIAQFAGKNSGTTSAVNLRAQDKVFAHLDNFEFEAKFTVTHFTLIIQKPRQDALIIKGTGSDLNAQMKAAMNTIGPGTRVFFDDITAVGPDGSSRPIAPILLTAN